MPSSYRVCHESMEGRISKRMFQENKARQIFQKNEHFLPPDIGKFGVLCFLQTPVLRFAFCLITDEYI